MDRNSRQQSAAQGHVEWPPSEAWLFAQLLLGKPIPTVSPAEADARAKREKLEWLAKISTRHEQELRRLQSAEAEERRKRAQLEWLATISTRHEQELRRLQHAEAEEREGRERLRRYAERSNAQLAEWDSAQHPRGGYPENPGE